MVEQEEKAGLLTTEPSFLLLGCLNFKIIFGELTRISFENKMIIKVYFGIRTEFPIISKMSLNILIYFVVCIYAKCSYQP